MPIPQFIEVTGTAPVIAEGIERSLADNIGKPVDFLRIDSDLTNVTGLGRFAAPDFSSPSAMAWRACSFARMRSHTRHLP